MFIGKFAVCETLMVDDEQSCRNLGDLSLIAIYRGGGVGGGGGVAEK